MAHHEHIHELPVELLDMIAGGSIQDEKDLAQAFVAFAKHDNVSLDDTIALLKKYNAHEDFASVGMDLDEVINEMRIQW